MRIDHFEFISYIAYGILKRLFNDERWWDCTDTDELCRITIGRSYISIYRVDEGIVNYDGYDPSFEDGWDGHYGARRDDIGSSAFMLGGMIFHLMRVNKIRSLNKIFVELSYHYE